MSTAPYLKPNFPPEKQQEAILTAVLNIQAHIMTLAGYMMRLDEKVDPPPVKPGERYPTLDAYKREFYLTCEGMKELYSSFGEIDTY